MYVLSAFRIALLSPVIALAVVIAAVLFSVSREGHKRRLRVLAVRVFFYALASAAISLGGTIAWMVWYESTTGFSSGNAPLGWIFFYGPISVAVGELVALIHWWLQKPQDDAPLEGT